MSSFLYETKCSDPPPPLSLHRKDKGFHLKFDAFPLRIQIVRDMGGATWGFSLPRVETARKRVFCEARCITFDLKLVYGEIKYLKVEKNEGF